jgi:hypothetical protein
VLDYGFSHTPTSATIRGLARDVDGVYWAVGDGGTLLRATSADGQSAWERIGVEG